MPRSFLTVFILTLLLLSCERKSAENDPKDGNSLFQKMLPSQTGINFQNTLTLAEDFDVFRYRNFYNGGGVAIGDINNDGLPDVYLTSNMGDNKLYLNKGNWKFEDITDKAGVSGTKVWSTGVSMVDINNDGLLDIYVCNSGDINGTRRQNEFFINNGDLTFTDRAPHLGLDDNGFSTHAAFFDYDKDGDLDCYVLNNSFRPIGTLGYRNLRNERDYDGGDRLYRNDEGIFHDVDEEAGIYSSVIGFGLGVTVADVNQDNWLDLIIANDFYERDYLYINNHDGTFSEKLPDYMGHISMFSMGTDVADINNDGYPDLFSTDMLPQDEYRLKTLTAFETYDVYKLRIKNGYYHQFMRNMLQLNNGDGSFSEIGQLAGVDATDWSWGALITDFDNSSKKEIFVCNGIYKDVIDQDFVEFLGSDQAMHDAIDGKKVDFKNFIDKMPSVKLNNYMLVADSNLHYTNKAAEWGMTEPSFSNGAAYGDLDNDGDLDLVINNVNQEAFVFKNRTNELTKNHYLGLKFKGDKLNVFGLGATVKVFANNEIIYNENIPFRGFQSSMDYKMIIGLGDLRKVDSLCVTWPNDLQQVIKQVSIDTTLVLNIADAKHLINTKSQNQKPLLTEVLKGSNITHIENNFNDFDRERLQYHMLSSQGPGVAVGDLNGDNLDDLFLCGSKGHASQLYIQNETGFKKVMTEVFDADSLSEGVDAAFFDADGDKDIDLYVVTGGAEYTGQSIQYLDILYENKGLKNGVPFFEKTNGRLPLLYQSGSCVRPTDIDKDGDIDLFVGTRYIPSYYGVPADQNILLNDGHGTFSTDVGTVDEFKSLGMVTDATWFDYDNNGYDDLCIVGEWMSPMLFLNDGKKLTRLKAIKGLDSLNGWWNTIMANDLDNDGDMDLVVGNLGLNSKFKATKETPVNLYVNDFDQNGSTEPIFTHQVDGKEYTMAMRQDLVKQMSSLKKKFLFYKDYASKSFAEIFDPKLIASATKLTLNEPRSMILLNNGKGFDASPLPIECQFSPIFGVLALDVNQDNRKDLLFGGNFYAAKPEAGRYDALHGLLAISNQNGKYKALSSLNSGVKIDGEVRHIKILRAGKKGAYVAFVRNNDNIKFFEITK